MLTGNAELLNKLGAMKKQIKEIEGEIKKRAESKAIDNNGYYIVYLEEIGQYMIVDEDFKSEV